VGVLVCQDSMYQTDEWSLSLSLLPVTITDKLLQPVFPPPPAIQNIDINISGVKLCILFVGFSSFKVMVV
jgi:hypothetical protein